MAPSVYREISLCVGYCPMIVEMPCSRGMCPGRRLVVVLQDDSFVSFQDDGDLGLIVPVRLGTDPRSVYSSQLTTWYLRRDRGARRSTATRPS